LRWLRSFRRTVAGEAERLCKVIESEIGKPSWEALTGDVVPLLASCRWHERHARRLLRSRRVGGRAVFQVGQRQEVVRVPLGRVGIIATWNYPVQLLGIQLVQAIVAGNDVVVKPSEHAPRSQRMLLEMAVAAGLPEGVLRWCAPTREAGAELLRTERLDHVVFTGSTGVGRAIAEWAAGTLTPTTLELSGHDSAIVLADADAGLAARSIWAGLVMNAGQTCMAPRRVLVERAAYPAFLRALAPLAAGAKPVMLISDASATRCFELARGAVASGGRSLSAVLEAPEGRMMRPLVVADCPPDAELVEGAHFGPVMAVVPVGSPDEALAIHRRCGQHLATSVFMRRPARARAMAAELGAGRVTVNDCILPTAHPATSIGGRGASGWGVSRGREGLLAMTRGVTLSVTHPRARPGLETPPESMVAKAMGFVRWWYGGRAGQAIRAEAPGDDSAVVVMHAGGAARQEVSQHG